jgi:DNA-binding transcriptional ArsR family regulator
MSTASAFSAAQVRDAAPLFAALGDRTRLRLLLRLSASGPDSIAGLSAKAEVSRQAIRKHLDVLHRAGLVRSQRRGREHLFELEPARIDSAREHLERISRQWDDALGRLRKFVEG